MGSYIHNNLITDEVVAYETSYHWIIFFSLQGICTLFIAPAIKRWSDEFGITNKRVIAKTGLISRETLELNLSKIESVSVDQSVMGRLLGYGSVVINGTGGTKEIFHNIAKPVTFRRVFQEMVDKHQ
jgi:uncharacterized membrane protein YdbT with pleckstrin-like domain